MQVENSLAGNDVDWQAVFNLDADGDGFSNGEELGDPAGGWTIGQPNPIRSVGNPSDATSTPPPCGNGVIGGAEVCEWTDLDGETCQSQGFVGGELECSRDCTFDTSGCNSCGNDTVNVGEDCDGTDLGEATCGDIGFSTGTLGCNADCTFDVSSCSNCGNGVADGIEVCDGDDLAGQTCRSQGLGEGELACTSSCGFDTAGCSQPDGLCGDGIAAGLEDCDGDDLGGMTCDALGFEEGELACSPGCSFDTLRCQGCPPQGCADVGEGGEPTSEQAADDGGGCHVASGGQKPPLLAMAIVLALLAIVARARL